MSDSGEEEELFVVAQFADLREPVFLEQTRTLRLKSFVEEPWCDADGMLFEGRHEACLGSLLLLRSEDGGESVPSSAPQIALCNTRTRLLLRQVGRGDRQQRPEDSREQPSAAGPSRS